MAEFMLGNLTYPLSGCADGRTATLPADVCLLSDGGEVLCARGTGVLSRGDGFFTRYPIPEGERAELRRFLDFDERPFLLLQGTDTPLLFARAPYVGTATVLSFLPKGELCEVLRAPAPYGAAFSGELCLSPTSRERTTLSLETGYAQISDFFSHTRALALPQTGGEEGATLLRTLTALSVSLSDLCRCRTAYDFCGLGLGAVREPQYGYLAGLMLSLCFMAGRLDTTVRFYADREESAAPVLHARMAVPEGETEFYELERPYYAAGERGLPFRYYIEGGTGRTLHIEAAFCSKEISRQQLRAFTPPQ